MQKQFLDYKEAAKVLGLPVGTLYSLVHKKSIPHVRLGDRLVRFDSEDLHLWVTAKKVSHRQSLSARGGAR